MFVLSWALVEQEHRTLLPFKQPCSVRSSRLVSVAKGPMLPLIVWLIRSRPASCIWAWCTSFLYARIILSRTASLAVARGGHPLTTVLTLQVGSYMTGAPVNVALQCRP